MKALLIIFQHYNTLEFGNENYFMLEIANPIVGHSGSVLNERGVSDAIPQCLIYVHFTSVMHLNNLYHKQMQERVQGINYCRKEVTAEDSALQSGCKSGS